MAARNLELAGDLDLRKTTDCSSTTVEALERPFSKLSRGEAATSSFPTNRECLMIVDIGNTRETYPISSI